MVCVVRYGAMRCAKKQIINLLKQIKNEEKHFIVGGVTTYDGDGSKADAP